MCHRSYELISKLVFSNYPKNKKISIIDYGCGNGFVLNFLPKNRIAKYCGYDINSDSIVIAREKYQSTEAYSFDLVGEGKVPSLGKENSVDVIILIGVVQYLSKKEFSEFLHEAKRVLKRDGGLVISCSVNHFLYRTLNIYRLFIPDEYVNRKEILKKLEKCGYKITYIREKGFILDPLFSNIFIFFFDALDRIIFGTRGRLGPIGIKVRLLTDVIIRLEYKFPFDYGATLFIKAKKK